MDFQKIWKQLNAGEPRKARWTRHPDNMAEEVFDAVSTNDLPRLKKLRAEGADLNVRVVGTLGSGTVIISSDGRVSQPEAETTTLMLALYSGYYEMSLYLAEEGVDATFERAEKNGGPSSEKGKALDLVLEDHVHERPMSARNMLRSIHDGGFMNAEAHAQRTKNYETDLYTPQQRLALIDAMLKHVENPMDLVSGQTRYNAVNWGRSEVIPKLAEMGVQFTDDDFVNAGHPIHRPGSALKTMQALLPFVESVNVTNSFGHENAGHAVARQSDLPAFQWLEANGLDKTALASGTNIPSYAHRAAVAKEGPESLAFIQHLAKQGYSMDTSTKAATGRDFNCNDTPIIAAIDEGNLASALAFVDEGAAVPADMLAKAVGRMHFNTTRSKQVCAFIEALDERGLLNAGNLKASADQIIYWGKINDKNLELMKPVAELLVAKATKLGIIEDIPWMPAEHSAPRSNPS